ncbi:regulator of chromosome condensation domain-containing protein [Heterostelium album PN500]|uniref:Regulator of chromosome condensation domain-containing protein n=1 Tax=Heterostelium pallidum (strain ATCC 26659 / Pp 5 / PN500) TaxID=670386 RepID=D3B0Y3_HETP5|nr:regulator of chromosome condensation domain-containing protein [Heterostelium album PN500]EFA84957.1 regulator of chromosome condensation domain-containing protein [Heterostelium album PN500]|eukprot:XP_020437067.1 regulator of chromosome condensation domain-containing protein [Heterostelium album PN500]
MSVYSFGLGINGALGHGVLEESAVPTKIDHFTKTKKRIKKIACGSYHTVFITDDEEMYMSGVCQDPKNLTSLFLGLSQNSMLGGGGSGGNSLQSAIDTFSVSTPDFRKLSVAAATSSDTASPHSLSPPASNNSSLESSPRRTMNLSQSVPMVAPPSSSSPPQPLPTLRIEESNAATTSTSTPTEEAHTEVEVETVTKVEVESNHENENNIHRTMSLAQSIVVGGPIGAGPEGEQRPPISTPMRIPLDFLYHGVPTPGSRIKQVSIGNYHIVLLTEAGNIWTWGSNSHGQLGIGLDVHSNIPRQVELKCIKQIATGVKHTAAINEWGELYMWGINEHGELGLGDTGIRRSPTRVAKLKSELVSLVSCSSTHSVCYTESGKLYSWGQCDKFGKIQTVPTIVPIHNYTESDAEGGGCGGGGAIRAIACGEWLTAALTQLGEVFLWEVSGKPTAIHHLLAGNSVRSIAMGNFHLICLTDNGERNYLRQLNILSKIYYKSMLMISSPSDPYVTSLLQLQAHNGGNHSNNNNNNSGGHSRSDSTGNSQSVSTSNLGAMNGGGGGQPIERSNSIVHSGSISSPSLLTANGTGTIRSRTTSIATIRGIFGLNTISNMHTDDSSISEEEVGGIFCDLNLLIKTTQTFLAKLDSRMENWDVDTMILGDIFLDESIISSFRVYIPYSDNYNSLCMTLFNAKKRSEKLISLLKECEKRSQNFGIKLNQSLVTDMDIKSLFLAPLQNVPRLFLVLKELVQNSSSSKRQHNNNDVDLLGLSSSKYQVLLERMNQNFQFVDPVEILNCSSNEFGNPQIMGGSLPQLVEKLTHHNISDPNFSNVFLLTFRAFTTPLSLMDLLAEKYERMPAVKGRVLNILTSWIVNHFYDFENDPIQQIIDPADHHPSSLSVKLEDWMKSHSNNTLLNSVKKEYEKQRETPIESRLNALSVIIPTATTTPTISLLNYTSIEIAQTLTTLNHTYFAKIDKREFLGQRWTKKKAPNIQLSTEHFNRISQFVIHEAIQGKSSKHRASIITHLIAIAQNCFELNNFMSVAAIIYGLDSSIISKWKKTWSKLSKDTMNSFEYLQKIVTPLKNYISLRHIMTTVQPPCIPFLGTYLKDLTFIEDGNPSRIGELVNFYKQRKIAEVVFQLHQYQQVLYDIPSNTVIRDYFLTVPLIDEKKAIQISSSYE